MRTLILGFIVAMLLPQNVLAKDSPDTGTVQIPRTEYDQILLQRVAHEDTSDQSPKYLFGDVSLSAHLEDEEHRIKGELETNIDVEILKDQWTTVHLLPLGTKIRSVEADGKKIHLQTTAEGLSFGGLKGHHHIKILSLIDESAENTGRAIVLPVPAGVAAHFTAEMNGTDLNPTLAPSTSVEVNVHDDRTSLQAEIPETAQATLSWHRSQGASFAANRGTYVGELSGDSVHWKGEISLDVFDREGVTYRILPITMTMSAVTVDGQETTILQENGWHAVRVHDVGKHKIQIEFMVPVQTNDGTPRLAFESPPLPVSRYELHLPGKKTVKVESGADIQNEVGDTQTQAVAHFPPSMPVSFSWTEEVPKETEAASQVNSAIYYSVVAEDGLLETEALATIEVARGEKTSLDFVLPAGIQLNKITGPADVQTDWRIISQDSKQIVRVFFERGLKGEFSLSFSYDRPLGAGAGTEVDVPLLLPLEMQRSRGMIALLSSKEFSFEPTREDSLIRVGENQLPVSWRQTIDKPIVHTFKYAGAEPSLGVKLAAPEKIRGKIDATVDTLISVGDVSYKGNASIDVTLKSGKLSELEFELPAGINILNVVAPSLRSHQVIAAGDKQKISLQFTQEMEGAFVVQLSYERIFGDAGDDISVPTVSVDGAEIEQGRVAVEALSAVEVQAVKSDRLSSLEPSELPKRLIMNTSNPILLGFRYFQANPAHDLRLKVIRHKEVDPQSALIETALYNTLVTKDGVAITSAEFLIHNSRKQFLKLLLPGKSEVWSATVDGKTEKPALENDSEQNREPGVLIRLVNSEQPFRVQLVYKTPLGSLGAFGDISSALPKPDLVISRSEWNVNLPDGLHFGLLRTNMDLAQPITKSTEIRSALLQSSPGMTELPLSEGGAHFSLKRLYATEAQGDSMFSVFYLNPAAFYSAIVIFVMGLGLIIGAQELKSLRHQLLMSGLGLSIASYVAYCAGIPLWIAFAVLLGLRVLQKLAPLGQRALNTRFNASHPAHTLEPQES